jgi:hypothetical protein
MGTKNKKSNNIDFTITTVFKEEVEKAEIVKKLTIWKISESAMGDKIVMTIQEDTTNSIEDDMLTIFDLEDHVLFKGHKNLFYFTVS